MASSPSLAPQPSGENASPSSLVPAAVADLKSDRSPAAADMVNGGQANPSPRTAAKTVRPLFDAAREEIREVARKYAAQAVQNPDPGVWAVLTAISKPARKRPQGINILLTAKEHYFGRCVEDSRFQIAAISVSSLHCKIYRVSLDEPRPDDPMHVLLKDSSTNGTYVNWMKLSKQSPAARLHHGDIISFAGLPHDESSYVFVYREVNTSTCMENTCITVKRKKEEACCENKRLKGIGIGSPDGPVSLDDVRSLQKANTELRQQLESHVLMIETLRNENRLVLVRHEDELKELRESFEKSHADRTRSLEHICDERQKTIDSLCFGASELQNSIKDLNERLSASKQSRADADEVIRSQKAAISELEAQLDEERNMRRDEREKAAVDLKSALQRVQIEAQAELERLSEVHMRQHREHLEVIAKLQDSEKESRLLIETLRAKLEDARDSLVISENKARQSEVQFQEEQLASANLRKRSETLENQIKTLEKELEIEKAAREEAWAKVSALELDIAATIRDLSLEKQRFQGARERIILRETQLRSFYSTTEEISLLFAKQQEQLKSMQRTLEDEENYENAFGGSDQTIPLAKVGYQKVVCSKITEEDSGTLVKNTPMSQASSSGQDGSTTEKHDGGIETEDQNTQEVECPSADNLAKGFGSDVDASKVRPAGKEFTETERVHETETQENYADEQNAPLQRCSILGGETMQLDDDVQPQENAASIPRMSNQVGNLGGETMQLDDEVQNQSVGAALVPDIQNANANASQEDTQTGTIRTADLLASDVAGSWAVNTAPSVHGENESPRSSRDAGDGGCRGDNDNDCPAAPAACDSVLPSDRHAAESQSNSNNKVSKVTKEHHLLSAMIAIVDPEFPKAFRHCDEATKNESMSDAETEEGDSHNDEASSNSNLRNVNGLDDETDMESSEAEGDTAMIDDSVG